MEAKRSANLWQIGNLRDVSGRGLEFEAYKENGIGSAVVCAFIIAVDDIGG